MKVLWRILLICFVISTTAAFSESSPCVTVDDVISCMCKSDEDVSLFIILQTHVRTLFVSGCRTASLPTGTLLYMELDNITFKDIETLIIRPYSLTGAEKISHLRIVNVAHLLVQPNAFSGLTNLTKMEFRNVSVQSARKGSFGPIHHVDEFIISDSVFHNTETDSFLFGNVKSFIVSHTTFMRMENSSILMLDAGRVDFHDSSFEQVDEESFVLVNVEEVAFTHCTFQKLGAASIFTSNVTSFSIQSTTFQTVKSDALVNVHVLDKFVLRDNTFETAEENSLSPNLTLSTNMDVSHNKFTCDCNLSWLWSKPDSELYLKSSDCINQNEGSLLSFLNNGGHDCEKSNVFTDNEWQDDAQYSPIRNSAVKASDYWYCLVILQLLELIMCIKFLL